MSAADTTRMWTFFKQHGWDKKEPGPPYPREQSRGFEQLVCRALAEDHISESKAAELLGLPLSELAAQRHMGVPPNAARQ